MSKVLLINGSSHEAGCTYTALKEVAGALEKEGVETQIYQLGGNAIRDCIGCGGSFGQKSRNHSIIGCSQQIFHHCQDAGGFFQLLEYGSWH